LVKELMEKARTSTGLRVTVEVPVHRCSPIVARYV
jgi:hypothetical protein